MFVFGFMPEEERGRSYFHVQALQPADVIRTNPRFLFPPSPASGSESEQERRWCILSATKSNWGVECQMLNEGCDSI